METIENDKRHRLSRMLQLHGYNACREALVHLEDHYLSSTNYESMEDFVSKLNQVITFESGASSSIIDPDLAHIAITKLKSHSGIKISTSQLATDGLESSDAPQVLTPQIPAHLKVKIKNVHQNSDDIDSESKPNEFNIHYNFLYKRLNALPIFQENFKITKLSTLTGSSQPNIRCLCFGLLVKDLSKIDGYTLIDSTGRVPVRITPETAFRNRLAYTNCNVIVEGVYVNPDDVLFAANIGLPPVLLDPIPDKSLACIDEKMVVILRDLHLDDDDVCRDLDVLFTGYNSMEDPPLLFLLIGDFTREQCDSSTFRSHMKKLIRIIRTCDKLLDCHFVFVPGPKDSQSQVTDKGINNLPRPPLSREQLPKNILQLSGLRNVHLASNPAHIYLGDRLISVVVHSYLKELSKHLIHDMSDHREEIIDTAKQIMLSNAHLTAGISKTYHSSMNLWHKPDLLILADTEALGNRYDYNSSRSNDTTFATVPSFSRSFSQFKVYIINSGEIDDSQVSPDALEAIEDQEQVETIQVEDSQVQSEQ